LSRKREQRPDAPAADDYTALRACLVGLPPTWYPDLLATLVEQSYVAGTWQPGGASRYVAQVEDRLNRAPGLAMDGLDPMRPL
jgi:hypothetical protein